MNSSLFGSATRDAVLKFVALAEQSYPNQIAQMLGLKLYAVQQAVNALQTSGMLSSRLVGGVRIVAINRAWFARKELSALLVRLAESDSQMRDAVAGLRKRPRRAGKDV